MTGAASVTRFTAPHAWHHPRCPPRHSASNLRPCFRAPRAAARTAPPARHPDTL